MSREPRRRLPSWWWLVPLLLLTFWLGARGLDANPIWRDEWYSIRDATVSINPIDIWNKTAATNPWHVPGYFIVLSAWGRLIGWTPPVLRALTLLVGMLALSYTYRLGRDLVSRRVGLYAAAILGTSAFFTYYLHEVRMYAFMVLFVVFTLWVYFRILRAKRPPEALAWLSFTCGAAAILYTHYFAAMPLIALGLYHLLIAPKNRRWWQITAALAISALLFVPWISALLKGLRLASVSTDRRALSMNYDDLLRMIAYLFSNGAEVLLLVVVVVAVVALRRHMHGAGRVWFMALATLAATVIVNQIVHIIGIPESRYLMALWPLLALVAALGIAQMGRWQRGLPLLVLGLWMALGVANSFNPEFAKFMYYDGIRLTFPVHVVMRELRDRAYPGDYIVNVMAADAQSGWYGHIFGFYQEREGPAGDFGAIETLPDDEAAQRQQSILTQIGQGRQGVWLAYLPESQAAPMSSLQAALLEAGYGLCGQVVSRPNVHIDEYARSSACCRPESGNHAPIIQYGDGLALSGFDLLPEQNGTLPVMLAWAGGDTMPPYTYSYALHVLDADGALVAQADTGLPPNAFLCSQQPIPIGDLPAGTYTVSVVVYAWESGAQLAGTLVATGEQGTRLPVRSFTITG
jgi:hypothetical protein